MTSSQPAAASGGSGLRDLLRVLPDLVLVLDRDGAILEVGDHLLPGLGWEPEQIAGRSLFEFLAKTSNHQLHSAALAEVVAVPGRHGPFHLTVLTGSGGLCEVEVAVTNALDDPNVGALLAIVRQTDPISDHERIRRAEAWSAAMLRGVSDLVLLADRTGLVAYASPSARSLIGLEPEHLVGQNLVDLVHPEDLRAPRNSVQTLDRLLGIGAGRRPVLRLRNAAGDWISVRLQRSTSHQLGRHSYVIVIRPQSQEEHATALLSDQAVLLERIARGEGVESCLEALAAFATLHLRSGELLISYQGPDVDLVSTSPSLDPALADIIRRTGLAYPPLSLTAPVAESQPHRTHAGDAVVAMASEGRFQAAWSADLQGADGLAIRLLLLRSDTADIEQVDLELLRLVADLAAIAVERHDLQARLAHGALHDELTGLPNRRYLMAQLLELERGKQPLVGLLYVNLDRFKVVNDSLGHDSGDQLLQETARRLRLAVRPGDVVARVNGDEFVVFCRSVATEDDLRTLADRVLGAVSGAVDLPGGQVVVTASVGVLGTEVVVDAASLLQAAGLAMHEAKSRGRNQVAVFEPQQWEKARDRMEVEKGLRDALSSQEMQLYYQPVVRLDDGSVVGVEALLRWNRPGIGLVRPDAFVSVATDTGLIVPLGRWVIDQALAAAARWPELEVAANLAASQLSDLGLVDYVAERLEAHGVEPGRFCLEVTEADLVVDPDLVAVQLRRFKDLGIRLAIDDFGTGFATLDYLRRFAVADIVKVDASFVAGVSDPSTSDLAIVSAAQVLAENLGFDTVAEGVETEAQRSVLLQLGCVLAQGHLFSKPVPAEEIDALRLTKLG